MNVGPKAFVPLDNLVKDILIIDLLCLSKKRPLVPWSVRRIEVSVDVMLLPPTIIWFEGAIIHDLANLEFAAHL